MTEYKNLLENQMLDTGAIEAVLERLRKRSKLSSFAGEIFRGLHFNSRKEPSLVTEEGGGTICKDDKPGQDVRFNCGGDVFKCDTSGEFSCPRTGVSYGDCKGEQLGYTCPDKYDCDREAYDCAAFNCGKSGAGTFACDEKYDYLCAYYQCEKDFTCTGGHVYGCEVEDVCKSSFGCSSSGDPKCTNDYSFPDDGGEDKTSGDFRCGYLSEDKPTFDCKDSFKCTSKDEFDCHASEGFKCGTGDGTDTFECGANTRFECDSDDDCTNNFKCLGTYVPPPPPES